MSAWTCGAGRPLAAPWGGKPQRTRPVRRVNCRARKARPDAPGNASSFDQYPLSRHLLADPYSMLKLLQLPQTPQLPYRQFSCCLFRNTDAHQFVFTSSQAVATIALLKTFTRKSSCFLHCRSRLVYPILSSSPSQLSRFLVTLPTMSSLKRKASNLPASSDAKKAKQNSSITSFFSAPKAAGGTTNGSSKAGGSGLPAADPPAPKFDKQKWVAGLTDEQRKLLQLEIDTMDESWLAHLKDEITTKEFLELKRFLERETAAGKKWFPPKEDVYSWYVYL